MVSACKHLNKAGMSSEKIVNHENTVALFTWFHGGKFPDWLKPDRQLARVQGTILADTSNIYDMSTNQLQSYLGSYLLSDGSKVTVFADDTGLSLKKIKHLWLTY